MKRFSRAIRLLSLLVAMPRGGGAEEFGPTLKEAWSVAARPITALTFAPDGSWFVAAAGARAFVFALGPEGQVVSKQGVSAHKEILGAAVSPDGKAMALVDGSGTLALYEVASFRLVALVNGAHKGKALSVTFTDDNSYVVTGGQDGKVRAWTLRGQLFADLGRSALHEEEVVLVAAVPQAHQVISVGKDRQVLLWDVDTQQVLRPSRVDFDVRSAGIGGKTLALGLQLLSGRRFHAGPTVRPSPTGRVVSPAPEGSLADTIKADDRVRLIDTETGLQLREVAGERQDLDAIAVTPDGRFVAAAGGGGDASVWDTTTGNRVITIPFRDPVTALAFDLSGKWMLAGTKAGKLSLLKLSGVGPAVRPPPPQTILVIIVEPTSLVDERGSNAPVPRIAKKSFRIRGKVKTSAPLRSILVGGREITSLQRDEAGDYVFSAYVPLPEPGRHQIEIVAENEGGAVAHRAFAVERAAEPEPASFEQGKRLALIVGVSRYNDSSIDLQYADADAKSLYQTLTSPSLGPASFRPENVRLLLNSEATVANINKGLREFLQQARENDFVLFFFAGHGSPDPNRLVDHYLLAHDTNPENIAGTGILMRHVREAISEIPARHVLILTDSCHSAGMAAPPGMRSLTTNPIHQAFLEKMRHASDSLAILTASESAQKSFEDASFDQHGIFTYFLLQGLKGKADADRDGIVALGELIEYVREKVRDATLSRQIPAIGPMNFDRDLPLSIVGPEPSPQDPKPQP